jgi:hypothetical protein
VRHLVFSAVAHGAACATDGPAEFRSGAETPCQLEALPDPLRPKNMEQIHYASSIHRDPFHFGVWDSQTDSPLADSESGGSRFGFKVTVGPADPGWVCQWVWNGVHTSPCTLLHTLPFFSPPSFHTISLSLAITCGWCNLKLVHT